jgi:OmpA-like transmembrane domain
MLRFETLISTGILSRKCLKMPSHAGVLCSKYSVRRKFPESGLAVVRRPISRRTILTTRSDHLNYVSPASSVKNSDNTYRISGGYHLLPIFSLEVHHTHLGKYTPESRALLAPSAGASTLAAKYRTSGFGIDALVSAPLGTGCSIYCRVGVMRAKTEANFALSGSIFVSPISRLDEVRTPPPIARASARNTISTNKSASAWKVSAMTN